MAQLAGKRILFVVTKSNWGGAQTYVYTLARHVQAEGAEVAVALGGIGLPGSGTGLLASRLAQAGIRTIVVPSFARDISLLREWRTLRELLALVRSERPDILHLNSSKAGGIGALAGRLAHVPRIIFTAHGWAHKESRGALARALIWLASLATVILSHIVIVLSDREYRSAPVFFSRRKLRVIHTGVPDFPVHEQEKARRFLAPTVAALARCSKWLLIPAELTRNKGIDIAIRAFAGVSTNIDDAALVIVGEGEEHAELAALIESYNLEKRAFMLGFVPDVRQYLNAADVFLMPSRKEGFSLALLEAGHAGIPVVASSVGGIPEIIEHEKSGILIRPENVDGLADAMTRLLTDTDEARKLGAELQKIVREKFSESEMLRKTTALYS